MGAAKTPGQTRSDPALEELVAKADKGARMPAGLAGRVLIGTALAWSLFQLWYASPLPFLFRFGVLNTTEARAVHLAFAVFLAYTAFPTLKRSPRDRVPLQDWGLAALGACCAAYLYVFKEQLAARPGNPTGYDLAVAGLGMVLLLEATRRALGLPLMIVASVFLAYVFFGNQPFIPETIQWKGASFAKAMSHQWLSTEGVFGVALGVSTDFVFLFVLFGALLERAGAGNYFIKVAYALLGHLRGGPAKAAVVASGMTGLISGSSIANVVTTGTFTIPLMKRIGFPSHKAGAIEVAASTNGQLTPPIMGAAAFLMVEYVGISYVEVIKHAFLPAVISYIALLYIVHLEAVKAGMEGLPPRAASPLVQRLLVFGLVVCGLVILSGAVYYGIGWTKEAFGAAASWVAGLLVAAAYLGLLWYASRYPELEADDPNAAAPDPPPLGPTLKSGLHFLLPVVVLVWCLIVERFSPGLAAFWATAFMMFIVATQRPIQAAFRGRGREGAAFRQGLADLFDGLAGGARNMIGIGVATAAAGIIVGTVTLTGIGLVMTEFVEVISGGNVVLMLLFTALICLILGMGLPTTANYIVVSSLMAPVIVALGAENGLIVPLIAVHLFVFYFGILADDTPPVGLAAFAAAAISRGDPIRTGVQGFTYDIRTAVLPFMFIFNTQLLLIGIESFWELLATIASAVLAILLFAAGTQGYFLSRSRLWESAALIALAFTLFRPDFWMDMAYPPLERLAPDQVLRHAGKQPDGATIRLVMEGETIDGDMVAKTVVLPLGPPGDGTARLEHAGLVLREEESRVLVDDVVFDGPAEKAGIDFDWEVKAVERPLEQPAEQWIYLPALGLLGLVAAIQRRRAARSPRRT